MLHKFVGRPISLTSSETAGKRYALDSCVSIPQPIFGNIGYSAGAFEGGQEGICPDVLYSQF